jgi:hypothetical protein
MNELQSPKSADLESLRRLLWERIFVSAEELYVANRKLGNWTYLQGTVIAYVPELCLEKWSRRDLAVDVAWPWHPEHARTWAEVVVAARQITVLTPEEAAFLLGLPPTGIARWMNQLGPFVGVAEG